MYQRAGKILQSKQQRQQQSKSSNKTKTRHHLSDDAVTITLEDLAGVHLTPFKEVSWREFIVFIGVCVHMLVLYDLINPEKKSLAI